MKKSAGEAKSVCIEDLTILIKDIINNKSRPDNYKNEDFIKNILLNKFGFQSDPPKTIGGMLDLKTKTHRAS